MQTSIPVTEFASAERVPVEVVQRQAQKLSEVPLTVEVLNSVLNCVFILNQHRQIVFLSKNCQALFPGKDLQKVAGQRPGEALDCVHAQDSIGGCGTSRFCQECGAVKAILGSLVGKSCTEECRITRLINLNKESLDLLVQANPVQIGDEQFTIFSVADISAEKRRQALERIFFHDVINTAGGLEGLAGILKTNAPPNLRPDLTLLESSLQDLLGEIYTQKDLTAAERNELSVSLSRISSRHFLNQIVALYQKHPLAENRWVAVSPDCADKTFSSDPVLLKRVLGNLIKNALEATNPGQTVMVGCDTMDDGMVFHINNPGVMPKTVQLQIFNRSFTTKGSGRGLGSYSVKLLTEKYLKGQVHFTSTAESGTTFFVVLPMSIG